MTRPATIWPGTVKIRSSYALLADHYVASTWDFKRFPGLREELIDFIGSLPKGPILDIGCGSGRDAALAISLGRSTVLADISVELLTRTVSRVEASAAVCCDATALPFRDCLFAGVIASGVLLHLPRPYISSALRGIYRVLVQGGLACISMKHGGLDGWRTTDDFPLPRWFSYFSLREFADLCSENGLEVKSVDTSPRKDWFTAVVIHP